MPFWVLHSGGDDKRQGAGERFDERVQKRRERTGVDHALSHLGVAEGEARGVHQLAQHVAGHLAVCARSYHQQRVPGRLHAQHIELWGYIY